VKGLSSRAAARQRVRLPLPSERCKHAGMAVLQTLWIPYMDAPGLRKLFFGCCSIGQALQPYIRPVEAHASDPDGKCAR
jgi:hypothetical protein